MCMEFMITLDFSAKLSHDLLSGRDLMIVFPPPMGQNYGAGVMRFKTAIVMADGKM